MDMGDSLMTMMEVMRKNIALPSRTSTGLELHESPAVGEPCQHAAGQPPLCTIHRWRRGRVPSAAAVASELLAKNDARVAHVRC
eukprot:9161211-Pyramimonas_sp.AAC.1